MNIKGKVIICDAIDETGIKSLKNSGLTVDYIPDISAQDLISKVAEYDVIVVRSRTKITKEVIQNAKNTKIIARVGVGLDNIDTDEASKQNIEVKLTSKINSSMGHFFLFSTKLTLPGI